jgi:hypothetical protein
VSTDCLVRPIAGDTDVGIDLYCETVQEGHPFLHFWLQVKSGSQCRLARDAASASCRFDEEHLKYWLRQPVPVFAALLSTEWPVRKDPSIYVVPITTILLTRARTHGKTATLRSDFVLRPGIQADLKTFLGQVVPDAAAQLECRKGIVAPRPQLFPEYVRSTPPMPVTRFAEEILDQIRTTATMSVVSLWLQKQLFGANLPFVQRLAGVVEQFADDPHWETSMALGLSRHADGDYIRAQEFYDEAKSRMERDLNLDVSQPPWSELIEHIDEMKCLASMKTPVRRG